MENAYIERKQWEVDWVLDGLEYKVGVVEKGDVAA